MECHCHWHSIAESVEVTSADEEVVSLYPEKQSYPNHIQHRQKQTFSEENA